jgi:hypothetical protein
LQLRLRAPTGTKFDRTEEMTKEAINFIAETVGPDNVALSLAYVGIIPPSYPINNVYLWTSGPEEAILRVALKPGSGIATEELKETLRTKLPERLATYLRVAAGLSAHQRKDRGQCAR